MSVVVRSGQKARPPRRARLPSPAPPTMPGLGRPNQGQLWRTGYGRGSACIDDVVDRYLVSSSEVQILRNCSLK